MTTVQLEALSLADATRSAGHLRRLGDGAGSMEQAAKRIVRHLYDNFLDAGGGRACALVRLFASGEVGALPAELRALAADERGPWPDEGVAMALLASAGDEPQWNDRRRSVSHRIVAMTGVPGRPVPPMVQQLVSQLGVDPAMVQPDPGFLVNPEPHPYNVYYVADAAGSPYVPDQELFVLRYGIRSVLGFGGLTPFGRLFTVVLFTKVPVSRRVADLLRPLAAAAKVSLIPFDAGPLLEEEPRPEGGPEPDVVVRRAEHEAAALRQLLDVHEDTTATQAEALQRAHSQREHEAEEESERLKGELRQAQKMEALGRLAGGIAHDFNNALQTISIFAELIRQDLPEGHPAHDCHDMLADAVKSASGLVRQLLVFSRPHPEQIELVEVEPFLRDTSKLLERLLGERFEVRTILEAGDVCVEIDAVQLQQIAMNLAINAGDAMPGGGTLTLGVRRTQIDGSTDPDLQPGPYVVLEVTDTGVGMDDATRARIFEPFFTTKDEGTGTGLGLSIVFGIAQQYGGGIRIDSVPGSGTTFEVLLPLAERHAQPEEPLAAPEGAGGAQTMLLVEDQPQARIALAELLRRHGYTALEAGDAASALERAERHEGPIHAVVTDGVLPDLDGPDLVEELLRRRPGIKILMLSGHPDAAGTPAEGPDRAAMSKPAAPDAILQTLRQLLDG